MHPRRPRSGQDSVKTEPRGLAAIGRKKVTAPITKPLQIRPDERTPAEKRVGQLLNIVLSGRKTTLDLWAIIQPHWHPAPRNIETIRWQLFNDAITDIARKEHQWRAATPKHCGAGKRTDVERCTARDTCSRHREHLGVWFDIEQKAVRYLMRRLPDDATAAAEREAPKKRGR